MSSTLEHDRAEARSSTLDPDRAKARSSTLDHDRAEAWGQDGFPCLLYI